MAQRIAESTSEVIGRGVLVTDENGIIIGCNVRKRVGTFHEPSVKVMQENKPSVTGREEAKKMPGVYPGYTLPIQFFRQGHRLRLDSGHTGGGGALRPPRAEAGGNHAARAGVPRIEPHPRARAARPRRERRLLRRLAGHERAHQHAGQGAGRHALALAKMSSSPK